MDTLNSTELTDLEKNNNLRPKKIARLVLPLVIILGFFLLIASNLYVAQILLYKLDKIENKLPVGEGAGLIVPIELTKGVPMLGKTEAKVTVVEFADYKCPYCKNFHEKIYNKLKTEFIDSGKVKYAYVNFAFLGEDSKTAAQASKCAKDQGKFWEFHSELYAQQANLTDQGFTEAILKSVAGKYKLDQLKFLDCLKTQKYITEVEEEGMLAADLGVEGTPTVFINNIEYTGDLTYLKFKQAILQALEESS